MLWQRRVNCLSVLVQSCDQKVAVQLQVEFLTPSPLVASSTESLPVERMQNQCVSLGAYGVSKAGVPSPFSLPGGRHNGVDSTASVSGTATKWEKPGFLKHRLEVRLLTRKEHLRQTVPRVSNKLYYIQTLGYLGLYVTGASVTLQSSTGGNYHF